MNEACRRGFPRQVAFCPFCGARQQAGPVQQEQQPPQPQPAPLPLPFAAEAAAPKVDLEKAPAPQAPQPKFTLNFGRKPISIPELEPEFAYRPALPPGPQPIRKRTWLMVAMVLAAIWLFAKPRSPEKQFAAQVEQGLALVERCRMVEARSALAALKSARATPAQVTRLQNALRAAAPACDKKRERARAWSAAAAAVDAQLQAAAFDKALARLAAFTRNWDEDEQTRALRDRIELRRGAALLDEADACLSRQERVCLENRLAAAEKLKRPELAQRIAALRVSLSKLLEATLLEAPR
ncbi:MAG TPA: hypothetical protein VGP06_06530 [Janthinobacterium sp.]|nr:hypothetical protein [Janthinobacterium sp.]